MMSGPCNSRMTCPLVTSWFSWYWQTSGADALINFPDAICRNALVSSAADRDTGTINLAAWVGSCSHNVPSGNTL
jgi:hypothetical protein